MINLGFRKKPEIWLFFICIIFVFLTHFTLYQPIIQFKLFNTTEDWPFLIAYRSLTPNPLTEIWYIWKSYGLHTTAQVYHIGILSEFLGYNYQAYQIVNIILKIIGTLSLYPLIIVVFKNRKLAFLSTILFGISSATAGSFLWVVKGSEYIGIALMNLFFVTYYFTIKKESKILFLLSSIIVLLAYLMAPPRMFPLPLFILAIEFFWLLKMGRLSNLKHSLIRVLLLVLPIYLISKPAPVSSMPFTSRPEMLLNDILAGNWHNLLDPFAGIGWTLFTNDFLQLLGQLQLDTFMSPTKYWIFLIRPTVIFAIATLILAFILSRKTIKFFLTVFITNFILDILMFILANHQYLISENLTNPQDGQFIYTKYPTLLGLYMLTLSFGCFLEWIKDKKNKLLLSLWVGPFLSVTFLWPTWIIMGPLINGYNGVNWYFGIPAMGITVFMASILVLFYEKLKYRKSLRIFAGSVIFAAIVIFYQGHGMAITKQYLGINPERIKLQDQQKLHEEFFNELDDPAKKGNMLVYFEINKDLVDLRRTDRFYEEALVLKDFGDWMHFRRKESPGCIYVVPNKEVLRSIVEVKNGEKGFVYKGNCLVKETDKIRYNNKDNIYYELKDFYAFRIQNGEFINITNEIIKELDF